MTSRSSISNLLICIIGIYGCYLSYGIFQEKIFKYRGVSGEKFTFTLFLLCLQCLTNCIIAYIATFIWKPTKKNIPIQSFSFTAFSYLGAMLCSNEALKYVSYPTQALGKSCKMIPVMLMGVLIRKRKYSWKDYACVLLITIGITIFQLGKVSDKKKTETNSAYGLLLLFLSLSLDGITGPKQEELINKYAPSVHQLMTYTNLWAFLYTLSGCFITNHGINGLLFCLNNPEFVQLLVIFCICSALGQNFIFFTIQRFSALTCTTITTTRKFFTILFSVLYFGHSLSIKSWSGVTFVFIGLGWELINKYEKYKVKKVEKNKEKE